MERREQISVPLDPALRKEIERIAKSEERTIAQQVRRWISDGLARAAEEQQAAA